MGKERLMNRFFLAAFLLFVIFFMGYASAAITVVNPLSNTNWSNATMFNVTYTNITEFTDATNASFYYNTTPTTWTLIAFGKCSIGALFSCSNTTTNLSSLIEGRYAINATLSNLSSTNDGGANDYHQYGATVLTQNVVFDHTPPNVSTFFNGTNYGNYSKMTMINVSISDNVAGVAFVYLNITHQNGTQFNFTRALTNPGITMYYNLSFNTTYFTDGRYNITVYANDSSGNLNQTQYINVTFDNTPPNSTFINLSNYGNYSSGLINITLWENDTTIGMDRGSVYLNFTNTAGTTQFGFNRTMNTTTFGPYYNLTLNTSASIFPDGFYNVTVWANDSLNNLNNTLTYQITLDKTPPNVTGFNNTINLGNYSGLIMLNSTVNDTTSGIAFVYFNITNAAGTTQYNFTRAMANAGAPGFYNLTLNTTYFTDGYYNITIWANDSAGNINKTTVINVTFDNTPPTNPTYISSFVNYGNYSAGLINLTVSATDALSGISTVYFNVTYPNGTWINGNFSRAMLIGSYYNLTFNAAGFVDGNYNITIWTNDSAGNTNKLVNYLVTLDKTKPLSNSSNISMPFGDNYNYTGTIKFNVSTTDASSGIASVVFNITNYTGNVQAATVTASPGAGNTWIASFSTTSLPDGIYNVTAQVTDGAGNQNFSAKRTNIIFDATSPTITFTCSPSGVYTGNSISCTCSAVDNLIGMNPTNISYTASPDTSSMGDYSTSCTASDFLNNTGTSLFTYHVSSSVSGSGTSNSFAVAPITNNSIPEIKVETSQTTKTITPETPMIMNNFNAAQTGVSQIQIEVNNIDSNAQINVTKYDSKPAGVSVSKDNTYEYLHIVTQNLQQNLSKAIITIQVNKSWITSNNFNEEDIALFRFDEQNNKWNELTTTISGRDANYTYYDIELTGFSYFAIAEKDKMQVPWNYVIIGTVVLVVIVLGIVFRKKIKKMFKHHR